MKNRSTIATIALLLAGTARAQTGIAVPSMTACDAAVQDILSTHGVNGASFALAKNGKLVFSRSYGHADLALSETTYPHHLFRLASVSKPITSIAVMLAVQNGQLALSDKVFGPGGLLENHVYLGAAPYTDMRLHDITVLQLLQHTAGWDRDIDCFPSPTSPYTWTTDGCDPISAPLHITQVLGEANPMDKYMPIAFLMAHGLDHDPGSTYAYSNIGYLVLGVVLESISGMSYEDYVKSNVLEPLGICDMHTGRNLMLDKLEREVEYEGNGYTAPSCYGTGALVPWEYGGWNLEAMDAHGGWVASARELVKLLVAVDGFTTKPDILNAASINAMVDPCAVNSGYAAGWSVNPFNNWWHTGSLDGTATMIARSSNQYTWAILLNKREIGNLSGAFWTAIDQLGWDCISSTANFPSHDLMAMPTENASAITFGNVGTGSVDVQWTNGDGDARLVVVRPATNATSFPLDGTDYTANDTYGLGTDLGNGNHVVFAGTGNSVQVNGLSPGTAYAFHVYEYDKSNATGNHALYMLCGRADAEVSTAVGVEEFTASESPVHLFMDGGDLLIRMDGPRAPVKVELWDVTGRALLSLSNVRDGQRIPTSGFSAGIHLVRISGYSGALLHQRLLLGR
ncbi:MAG: serine hydrolase [Flavobacteriales bacterium]|nr:serine hydrolase [Flavobacteriales bacterium]